MKTLDELALEYGTDKASAFGPNLSRFAGDGPHDYARHYDKVFASKREKSISLLEIGVGDGPSIRMWLDYFPKALVFGVDNDKNIGEWTRDTSPAPGRYMFVHGDQGDGAFWDKFLEEHGRDWDIIIDDGSHYNDHVILTFDKLWPAVASHGCYCIEDLGVVHKSSGVHVRTGAPDHLAFLKGLVDKLNLESDIDSIHLANELAILVKK